MPRIQRQAASRRLSLIGSTLLVCGPAFAGGADLDASFRAALARSEVVAIQSELIEQQEELYSQAKGGLLPSVSAVGSYLWQQTPSSSVGSTVSPGTQPLAKLTATQPLFKGFREFAGLRQARELLRSQQDAWEAAGTQLYREVAASFYSVISLERDRADLLQEIELYDRRVRDLQARVRIGRSRVSEVLAVQATRANFSAQAEALDGQIRAQRELFAFLTGLGAGTQLSDTETTPIPLPELDAYVSKLDWRADVRSEEKKLQAAEEGVSVARGAHLPSVDATANYYVHRTGSLKEVTWDAQLLMTLPIFQGGVLSSRTRFAESQRMQLELSLRRVRRLAEEEVRSLYETLQAGRRQVEAYVQAVELSRRNYEEQTREYRLGLVTNLEVLQALTSFEASSRALSRARTSVKLDFARLEVAAGLRPTAAQLGRGEQAR